MRAPLLPLVLVTFLAGAAQARDSVVAPPGLAPLQQLVESARHPDLHWANLADVQGDLSRLYTGRDWAPLWFVGDTLTTPAQALIRVLSEAANRGLDPADYDAPWLAAKAAEGVGADSGLTARVELGLSVAALRFAAALRHGRVSPAAVHGTFRLPADSFDVAATVQSLSQTATPNDVLRALEPQHVVRGGGL